MNKPLNRINRYINMLICAGLFLFGFAGDSTISHANDNERPYMGFPFYPTVFMSSNPERFVENFYLRSDIISIHWDSGVPWAIIENCVDIANCTLDDPVLQATLDNFRLIVDNLAIHSSGFKADENKRVYLALNPLNIERDGLSPNYELASLSAPADSFADETVRMLYSRFVDYMLDAFQPDYFSQGIEINMYARHHPDDFASLVSLMADIHDDLARDYPDLINAPTLQWEFLKQSLDNDPIQAEALTSMLDHWDSAGDAYFISTYPNIFLNLDTVDSSLYDFELYGLTISAETPLFISEASVQGDLQRQLLETLTGLPEDYDLGFLVWFFMEDFSALDLPPGLSNLGLYDDSMPETLSPRPGLLWWDDYFNRSLP